jgi:5-methylcytosine-specific restriction endonuclease McrA
MPYKDSEKARESARKSYRKNSKKILEKHKQYREAHHDEIRKQQEEYREKNRDMINTKNKERRATPEYKEYVKEYSKRYRKLPEAKKKLSVNQRKWRETHPEYNRERLSKWQKENPEKVRKISHDRRAKIANCEGTYTIEEINELFAWQRGDCYYCGEFLYIDYPYHIDHVIPISRGGPNSIENIVLACPHCNISKNDRTAAEFLEPHCD